jgi:serine protease Do
MFSSIAANWLLMGTGIIKPDVTRTINQNREKIVLQEGEAMSGVFKKVSPATVSIVTEFPAPLSRIFGTTAVQKGAGSGMVIASDGYILTNKHVVPEGVTHVNIVMADGKQYNDVAIVGRDPLNDIAFLKINGVSNMPAVEFGDSSTVQPGQRVVAIGNALGQFRNTITAGIISGIGRPLEASDGTGSSEKLENLFQTDAAVNPGNSGGPLLTLDGKVVGINVAMAEQAQAIGFSIPINDAKRLIDMVRRDGKIVKPYLGARYVSITPENSSIINVNTDHGAFITGGTSQVAVLPGSPADKAGLREHDIILKVNNTDVTQDKTLASIISQFGPGDKITLTIQRSGKEIKVPVTLEAYPVATTQN